MYTLGGTDAASFGIVASTGQLQTKAALDYESPGDADGDNVYEVTVSVSDGLDDAGTADNAADDTVAVTIEVADVDEPPVVTGPTGPSHPENSAGLVATYSAVDPEGSAVTWDLSGDDAAHFYWIVTNGRYSLFVLPAFVLPSVVRSLPDVESPADADSDNVYEVTVEASDGSTTGTLQVEVTITDVNEAPALTGPRNSRSRRRNRHHHNRGHLHRRRSRERVHLMVAVRRRFRRLQHFSRQAQLQRGARFRGSRRCRPKQCLQSHN